VTPLSSARVSLLLGGINAEAATGDLKEPGSGSERESKSLTELYCNMYSFFFFKKKKTAFLSSSGMRGEKRVERVLHG